jgi:hypothetical protein
MIKPLPNGKAKSIIVQMCKCNLLLEVAGFSWRIYGLLRKNPIVFEINCKVPGVA